MKKPTGEIGPIKIKNNPDNNPESSFEKIEFPNEKSDIEDYIVSKFIYSANKILSISGEKFIIANPVKNSENHFDFNITTPRGPTYLELMEAAPLELIKGGYTNAKASYKPYDMAMNIIEKINNKCNKYSKNLDQKLFLLIYGTHWAFYFDDLTILYLRYFLSKKKIIFNAIFTYFPLDTDEGTVPWLFPVPPEFINNFDPDKYVDNTVINLDPNKWKLIY
jgi:hypothetical protein